MKKHENPVLVTRSSLPPLEEYTKILEPLRRSAWLTNMGAYHEQSRGELKSYLGVSQLELFTSGHMALELVIQAMRLRGGVITTPFSSMSTTHVIVRNGLEPVLCDINPENYTMDADQLESLITEKTSAIMPVHVYGNLYNVERIQEIASRHHLKVTCDAAHAFREVFDSVDVGKFEDASMFSFHVTKVFHNIEDGAVAFQESEMADLLYQLRNFGVTGYESAGYVGANRKMNEFQAAMRIYNLRHVGEEITKREVIMERYRERLYRIEGIHMTRENPRVEYSCTYISVVSDGYRLDRDQVFDTLKEWNIIPRKYFYPYINAYDCYENRFDENDTPVTRRISEQVLTLPLYADLPLGTVDEICDVIIGLGQRPQISFSGYFGR